MPDAASTIRLVSLAVGMPSVIGANRRGDVTSGIAKRETEASEVVVRRTNIDGDRQADLRVHGGPDKAIYCYPREHRQFWLEEIGYARAESPFGENLSTEGIDEDAAQIGDIWRWGTARLQISQPRWPCHKLALHSGHPDMVKRFVAAGRCGWYLRVLEEGVAPTSGTIEIVERDSLGVSVRTAFLAARGDIDPALFEVANTHPALAAAWRRDAPEW
ncbi:MAG: MOSC domain-containing protein, partial [Chloroflexia bacterium]|nr:MOSC domain-containing protein [Chloroflexia bacterium]